MQLFPFPQRLSPLPGHCPSHLEPTTRVAPTETHPDGYALTLSTDSIEIEAANDAAAFHARTTLEQILAQSGGTLPCLKIEDWPDLPVRGYMLDISRCKVPTQNSLYELVDLLAFLKYNQLQLYTEHTFAYSEHPAVWQDASPLTKDDIQALDAYCRDRYIELVPNQNTFGHMERWLKHPSYQRLAESPDGFLHPISGWRPCGSTLKPTQESADFVDSLLTELLPNFNSRQVNIGGDEPWELGQGYSKNEVSRRGKTRVYLDHLLRIQEKIQARGYRMQFWGDIIISQPDLAKELSPNTTALLWGYEVDHPFPQQCQAMRDAGADFYVVPGTSTWNSIGGRLYTARPNIQAACDNARRYGAKGLLLTDWGDNGHHQSHKLSTIPILQAAGTAWNQSSADADLQFAATQLIPHPLSLSEYKSVEALSSISSSFSTYLHNASWLNKILFAKKREYATLAESLIPSELQAALEQLDSLAAEGELELARSLLTYAAQKGLAIKRKQAPAPISADALEEFKRHWLTRNRPGGLEESLACFPPG